MRATSLEDEMVIVDLVDKEPIGFNVALASACVAPNEFVITDDWMNYSVNASRDSAISGTLRQLIT